MHIQATKQQKKLNCTICTCSTENKNNKTLCTFQLERSDIHKLNMKDTLIRMLEHNSLLQIQPQISSLHLRALVKPVGKTGHLVETQLYASSFLTALPSERKAQSINNSQKKHCQWIQFNASVDTFLLKAVLTANHLIDTEHSKIHNSINLNNKT